MREASWHKARGRKNCAKLQSTRGPPLLCSCQTLPSGSVGPVLLYLLSYFFPHAFFFFNIYILIKKIFWFLKYQYIFVAQLWYRVDSLQSLLYSIRSRWNIFLSPGKNIFFPKFFVENILFLAKSLFFLHQTLYYCLLAAVYYFLHIWVHLRITCPSPTTSFQNFIWHLNFKLSCY